MGRVAVSSAAKVGWEWRKGGGAGGGVAIGLFLIILSADCASDDRATVTLFIVDTSEVTQKRNTTHVIFIRNTMSFEKVVAFLSKVGSMFPLLLMLFLVEA